jgi:hypothetical protein
MPFVERHLLGGAGLGNAHLRKIDFGFRRMPTLDAPVPLRWRVARTSTATARPQSLLTRAKSPSIGAANIIIGANE